MGHRKTLGQRNGFVLRLLALMVSAGALSCTADSPSAPVAELQQSEPTLTNPSASAVKSSEENSRVGAAIQSAAAARGPSVAGEVAVAVRMLRWLPADSIETWRRGLDRIAATSRRGEASVALRRQLLHAIAAPNEALFRERLRQLPVTIATEPGTSEGVSGHYRTYLVQGVPRVRLFIPDPAGAEESAELDAAVESWDTVDEWLEDDGETIAPPARGAVASPAISGSYCETYTPDGQFFSGECATQEEIDDAAIALAALDAEISFEATQVASSGGCNVFDGEDACRTLEEELDYEEVADASASALAHAYAPDWLAEDAERESGHLGSWAKDSDAVCEQPTWHDGAMEERSIAQESCLGEALVAAGSVAGWVGAKYAAYAVMSSATPATGAVGWAVFGALTTGWFAAAAVNSYLDCKAT